MFSVLIYLFIFKLGCKRRLLGINFDMSLGYAFTIFLGWAEWFITSWLGTYSSPFHCFRMQLFQEATLAVAEAERKKREKRKHASLRNKGRKGITLYHIISAF